jgi:hypothetical protein
VAAGQLLQPRGRPAARDGDGAVGHPGGGALPGDEVALGRELAVGLEDHPARDAELVRQGARGRQRDAGHQPAGADGVRSARST